MVNDMICSECGNEMMIDRVEDEQPIYVCVNRNCLEYLKAVKDGEVTNATITEMSAE